MWTRLDDKFWSDRTVEKAGNEAAGAFVRMLSYCGDQLTDGVVTEGVARFIAKPRTLDKLLEFGLIEKYGDDFRIPTYLDFNPSREKVMERRERDRNRKGGDGE